MPPKKPNVEQLVLSKIVGTSSIVEWLDAGITEKFFLEADKWRVSYVWVQKYFSEHGEVPNHSAFNRQFPNHDLLDEVEDPVKALIDEFIAKRQRLLALEGMQEAGKQHRDGDVPAALSTLQQMLSNVSIETSKTDVVSSRDFISAVVQAAIDRETGSMVGVPTGFGTIDESIGGMQREQFLVFIALPKHGKSTISLMIAIHANKVGWRVLYLTFEMSNSEVQSRMLSLGAEVSLTKILRGGLDDEEVVKLRGFEEEMLDRPDFILVHDTTSHMTVGGIAAKIEQHKPDLVVIDGMYLMLDEKGERDGSPQALTNITRSIKMLAQRHRIPIIGTTQALISRTARRTGTQLASIAYTSSFAQDADAIFGLDREDLMQPTAKLKVIAARNSLGVEVDLRFDYGIGLVEETVGFATNFPDAKKKSTVKDDDLD